MKSTLTSPFRRRLGTLALAAGLAAGLSAGPARAQVLSPETDTDQAVVLSPFVVKTDKDSGYMANSTLSGTRTSTDIKDIGNPLDIFTKELMQDLAVQDIQDLTLFASGVEPNAAGDFNSDGQEREVWNYNYMQIRGFKTGELTRNFMNLNAQFEAYNSERVEFSKGPNAILAGFGNPGGSVNYTTKTPQLRRQFYSVEHRTDDLGSQRVSVDVNQPLIPDKLGLRLNLMAEDQDFYRNPAYEMQTAWHLAGQWRPSRNTTLNLSHERRNSDRASPRGIFARDRVTAWLNAGSPIVTSVPSNNNVVVAGLSGTRTAASLGMATLNGDNWILDSDGVIRNSRRTARGHITNANTSNMDTAATGLAFPLDVWVGGANGINDSDWDITEVSVTQRINDRLYVDAAYGRSVNDVFQGNSVSRELYVDPNGFADNKHAGELYAETRPFWIDRGIAIEHFRASVSYELPLTKVNKWLGDHRFAAAYEYNERDEWWDNGRLTLTATPAGPINPASFSGGYQNNALAFNIRDYLNPAKGHFSQRDLRPLYYSNGISQDGYEARYVRRESWASIHTLTEQESALGVWQARWLDNRLITNIGLRKDERTEFIAPFVLDPTGQWAPKQVREGTPAGATHPQYAAFIDPAKLDDGISRNYGAVFHATKWASLTFNYATNFSPRVESRGLFGDFVPSSTGESIDFGFRLNLMENRLNVSLVRYETTELGSPTNGNAINSPFGDLVEIEEILVDNGIIKSSPLIGVFTTTDRRARGEELTIIGNPTPNWTFRLAASRLDNRQTNVAPDVRAYFNANMAFYESQNLNLTAAGSTTTLATRITEAKTAYALMNTRENVQVFPASEYTARLTGKYSFGRETAFKGFNVGGSLRWSSAPVIGYYRTAANTFDANRSHKGDDPVYTDFFVGYQRRFRFMRDINWRVQLNVSNLFDRDAPLPVAAINNTDAADFTWQAYRFRPVDGRVITLTNSFTF